MPPQFSVSRQNDALAEIEPITLDDEFKGVIAPFVSHKHVYTHPNPEGGASPTVAISLAISRRFFQLNG